MRGTNFWGLLVFFVESKTLCFFFFVKSKNLCFILKIFSRYVKEVFVVNIKLFRNSTVNQISVKRKLMCEMLLPPGNNLHGSFFFMKTNTATICHHQVFG